MCLTKEEISVLREFVSTAAFHAGYYAGGIDKDAKTEADHERATESFLRARILIAKTDNILKKYESMK